MMPKSAKGGGRNRSVKKTERYSVPITAQLAARLKAAAKGRADDAALLVQSDGSPWGNNPGQNYHRQVDKVVTAIGLDPAEVTMYCLRHSSIVRMLLKNIPIRLVASLHNTSVAMIERHYSKYITEHIDDISRDALLHHEPRLPTTSCRSRGDKLPEFRLLIPALKLNAGNWIPMRTGNSQMRRTRCSMPMRPPPTIWGWSLGGRGESIRAEILSIDQRDPRDARWCCRFAGTEFGPMAKAHRGKFPAGPFSVEHK